MDFVNYYNDWFVYILQWALNKKFVCGRPEAFLFEIRLWRGEFGMRTKSNFL